VGREEILNEVSAIQKLYDEKQHENLVTIIHHGWFTQSSMYFIDMELCRFNLDEYIKNEVEPDIFLSDNPRLLGVIFQERNLCHTWDIMEQICSGLHFIHSCKQVHRDLKPRNGTLNTFHG
jgi:serine/threonine protein kinase